MESIRAETGTWCFGFRQHRFFQAVPPGLVSFLFARPSPELEASHSVLPNNGPSFLLTVAVAPRKAADLTNWPRSLVIDAFVPDASFLAPISVSPFL